VLVTMARETGPLREPGAGPAPETDIPKRGDLIGRYVVLEARGAGGMGFVLSAHDAQLDRKIALKLVRPELEEKGGAEKTRARLLREAQLMARVRHPNVVTVYDVGTLGERVFIAMELVEGRTLRAWLKEGPHAVGEVLPIFLQAGWGLAAAHAAGVVHRDFKPENVLLDADGHPHVTDFGIAWSHVMPGADELPSPSPSPSAADASGLKGTPAYMSPEQLRNEPVDARSDQFSFCVALFEALAGRRPFKRNDRPVVEQDARLPAHVDAALRRGLSAQPGERFPDMPSLLKALAPPARRGLWLSVAATAFVLVAGTGAFVATHANGCGDGARLLEGAWSPQRRADIQHAFNGTGAPFATSAFDAVSAGLEHRAQQWGAAFKTSCEAGEDSWPRTRVCLEARLGELRALSELFARADTPIVEHAALATARLKAPDACLKGDIATTLPLPDDPQRRAAVAQVRLELAASQAHESAGRSEEAASIARVALDRAKATAYPPVVAEAWLALVEPLRDAGKYDEARRALDEAEVAAQAGRHFDAQLMAAVKRVRVADSSNVEDGDKWIRRAEAALEQTQQPEVRAELDSAAAVLKLAERNTSEAIRRSDKARAWYEAQGREAEALGERHVSALAMRSEGMTARALDELTSLMGEYARVLGPAHPLTLHVRVHVAEAALDAVEAQKALDALDDESFGDRLTPSWAALRLALKGEALRMQGKLDEAIAAQRQATELSQSPRGTALLRLRLAASLRDARKLDEAEAQLDEAKGQLDARQTLLWTLALAQLRLAQGRGAEALTLATEATKGLTPLVSVTAPELFEAWLTVSDAALATKDAFQAGRAADEALARVPEGSLNNARGVLRRARARPGANEELANAKAKLEAAGVMAIELRSP
jgi:tetratricopeptide (TPR) repeat protein